MPFIRQDAYYNLTKSQFDIMPFIGQDAYYNLTRGQKKRVAADKKKAAKFYRDAVGYNNSLQIYYGRVVKLEKEIAAIHADPTKSLMPMTRKSALKKIEEVKTIARKANQELAITKAHAITRFAKSFKKASHAETSKDKAKKSMKKIINYKKDAERKSKSIANKVHGKGFFRQIAKGVKQVAASPARLGFNTLIRLNVWDMAAKLAAKRSAGGREWNKIQDIWKKKFGGSHKTLGKSIDKGRRKKPIIIRFKKKKGFDGFTKYEIYVEENGRGYYSVDPVTAATAAVVAATPIVVALMSLIKPDMDEETVESVQETPSPEDVGIVPPDPIVGPDGSVAEMQPDGTIKITSPEGIVTITDSEGNIISGGVSPGMSILGKVAIGAGIATGVGLLALGISKMIKMRKVAAPAA